MLKRVLAILVAGIVVIAAAVVYKQTQKQEFGETELKEELVERLETTELSPEQRAYVVGLIDWAHPEAYEAAFTTREGMTGGEVNADRYDSLVMARIIERAETDGQSQVVELLERFKRMHGIQ